MSHKCNFCQVFFAAWTFPKNVSVVFKQMSTLQVPVCFM